jgi:hypothetical protein
MTFDLISKIVQQQLTSHDERKDEVHIINSGESILLTSIEAEPEQPTAPSNDFYSDGRLDVTTQYLFKV